ncbi:MAG: transglutaminase family protein [Gloeobacteraceae cyanobacterium ES-bin-144]|nr:transglutaminase family protein [Verrucomicrobiales bacterium]
MADATTAGAVIDSLAANTHAAGMRLSVLHRTTFHYGSPVTHSLNTLHLEPRTFPYQKTLSALIRVIPATRLRRFTDLFQNITQHFELPEPHTKLEIESRIRVHNLPLDISDGSRAATLNEYRDSSIRERIWPFLQESIRVSNSPEVWRATIDVTNGASSIYNQACAIMDWIHREFIYEPGATAVTTHLSETFELKKGVCQDFTHVMLGMCRSVGIAARYASGYLYNGPKDTLVGAQASHAWCEVYLPAAGWIGFDPTNNTLADERYVKVAVGRDYDDVAPVVGSYHGSGLCRMEVHVEVQSI